VTITNGYATRDQLKAELGIPVSNTNQDDLLDAAINAASRQIDGVTGWPHGFWQDGTVVAREFYAESHYCLDVPEGISTTTGLIVKIDEDGDGTFERTLTISTDFLVAPVNAGDNVPAWPYTEIIVTDNYSLPLLSNRRPGVQITAKFGWPAVPDDIAKACLVLAHDLYKAKDAPFGVAGIADQGVLRVGTNRTAALLLAPYKRPSVG
jgi:hypothetical protein